MAQQPSAAATYNFISAKGTTVVSDIPVNFHRVIVNGTFVGSVEFYDTTTAAGTAAGNLLYNLGIPATNINKSYDLDVKTKTGLVVVATGTPLVYYTLD